MKSLIVLIAIAVVSLLCASAAQAQQRATREADPEAGNRAAQAPSEGLPQLVVPRLVRFSGIAKDSLDKPRTGIVGLTFAIYKDQEGGAALWLETQNAELNEEGRYTVLLGATKSEGMPLELFTSGEPRWLGVRVQLPGAGEVEQPRVLLVSVPYALKAADAETLGGKPASAFVTTETLAGNSAGAATTTPASFSAPTSLSSSQTQTAPKKAAAGPQVVTPCSSVTSDGTAAVNSVAKFTTTCNIQSSAISEVSGKVGIGTASPAVAVDVLGNNAGLRLSGTGTHQVTVTGLTSGRLGQDSSGFFFASDTNGKSVRFLTNNGTLNEWMRITSAGNVGIGTATPAATLHVAGTLNLPVGQFTGNTSASQSFILAATQSGSNATAFDGTPATIPPVAVGGIASAATGIAAGVGGMTSNSSAVGVGAVNFATLDGTAMFAFSAASGNGSAVDAIEGGTSGFTRGVHATVNSVGGVAGLFDNIANGGAGGDLLIGRIGTSGGHVDQFRVDGSGDVLVVGNFHSATPGNGIILKSPNGSVCKLLGIDNTGAMTLTTVTCPPAP